MQIIETQVAFKENADGLLIEHSQHIPDEFLTECRLERADSLHTPAGEFHRVARLPQAVLEEWIAQGVDVWNLTAKEVIRLLQRKDLDAFITTNKRI